MTIKSLLPAIPLLLCSCAGNYSIQGQSSIMSLDDSQMYLKRFKSGNMQSIDSCKVLHGAFSFAGELDTVCLAHLFIGQDNIMPLVLEPGKIKVKIDAMEQSVGGTAMNDTLYGFIQRHNQIDSRMNELGHKHSQMLLDGISEDEANQKISIEADKLRMEEDRLVTGFITQNFDNILGPSVFMIITGNYPYPILTPQIEDIMSRATDKFKADPYVREYMDKAKANEEKLQNGGAE